MSKKADSEVEVFQLLFRKLKKDNPVQEHQIRKVTNNQGYPAGSIPKEYIEIFGLWSYFLNGSLYFDITPNPNLMRRELILTFLPPPTSRKELEEKEE